MGKKYFGYFISFINIYSKENEHLNNVYKAALRGEGFSYRGVYEEGVRVVFIGDV